MFVQPHVEDVLHRLLQPRNHHHEADGEQVRLDVSPLAALIRSAKICKFFRPCVPPLVADLFFKSSSREILFTSSLIVFLQWLIFGQGVCLLLLQGGHRRRPPGAQQGRAWRGHADEPGPRNGKNDPNRFNLNPITGTCQRQNIE